VFPAGRSDSYRLGKVPPRASGTEPDYFKLKGAPERRTLTWWALENPEG